MYVCMFIICLNVCLRIIFLKVLYEKMDLFEHVCCVIGMRNPLDVRSVNISLSGNVASFLTEFSKHSNYSSVSFYQNTYNMIICTFVTVYNLAQFCDGSWQKWASKAYNYVNAAFTCSSDVILPSSVCSCVTRQCFWAKLGKFKSNVKVRATLGKWDHTRSTWMQHYLSNFPSCCSDLRRCIQVSYLWLKFSLECHSTSISNTIPKNTFSMTLCGDECQGSQNTRSTISELNAWLIGCQITIPADSILNRYLNAKTQKVFGSFCVIF